MIMELARKMWSQKKIEMENGEDGTGKEILCVPKWSAAAFLSESPKLCRSGLERRLGLEALPSQFNSN